MSDMETETERRVEGEPSGSSVLCESTTVVGSVGGLRGTEKSVQLSGETAAQEQWCRGGMYERIRKVVAYSLGLITYGITLHTG